MNDEPGIGALAPLAPRPDDSIAELLCKAEEMLEYLQENEAFLRKFPTGALEERRALWEPMTELLRRALADPRLADDARLEMQRVWAEENHHSALYIVTMCVHARSESARTRFADDPEALEELIVKLERSRAAAMRVLAREDLDWLRARGFLRAGE